MRVFDSCVVEMHFFFYYAALRAEMKVGSVL